MIKIDRSKMFIPICKKYFLIILVFVFRFSGLGQNLPVIKPKIFKSSGYTREEQIFWQKALDLYEKSNTAEVDYDKLSKVNKKMIDSLEQGYGPLTQTVSCSWYCGGGPYKITATSSLNSDGKNTYLAKNSHDFDLFTAWAPSKESGRVGEKLNFYFEPFSPRVNKINIFNGYIKNVDLWKANARVAKFKVLVNGKPIAILKLDDTSDMQSFTIAPQQSKIKNKDLILTLEILEIYKGSTYDDVVISEINFDGLDVHCFGKGTQITMADQSTKSIELVKKDDWVVSYDLLTNELIKTQVVELIKVPHSNLLKLIFEDREILTTDDHPFWVEGKNWASINPVKANLNYHQESKVKKLNLGDKVFCPTENKFITLLRVETNAQPQMTYTINLTNGNSFIANGLLVKTEMIKD